MFWFVVSVVLLFIVINSMRGNVGQKAKDLRVKTFLKAADQWKLASMNDTDPIIALTHASFATAYMNAARVLMSDNELQIFINAPIEPIVKSYEKNQDYITKKVLDEKQK